MSRKDFEHSKELNHYSRSLAAIRAQAKKEIEAEQAATAAAAAAEEEPTSSKPPPSPKQQDPDRLAVSGIYFACPLIGRTSILFSSEKLKKLFFLLPQVLKF